MVFLIFKLSIPKISISHEFGHKHLSKILILDLLFITVYFTKRDSKMGQFLRNFVSGVGAEQIPQYREQIKKIKVRERAYAQSLVKEQIDSLEADLQKANANYSKLKNDVAVLRNLGYQVRNLKDFDFSKLNDI